VFAGIVARDVRKGGIKVVVSERQKLGPRRVRAKRASDTAEGPGAAEVKAVEVGDLAVGPVGNASWLETTYGRFR
jgi:hypothetical protein